MAGADQTDEALHQLLTKQFSAFDPEPDGFNITEWTIIKQAGQTVAATHISGETRKLPAAWFQ